MPASSGMVEVEPSMRGRLFRRAASGSSAEDAGRPDGRVTAPRQEANNRQKGRSGVDAQRFHDHDSFPSTKPV